VPRPLIFVRLCYTAWLYLSASYVPHANREGTQSVSDPTQFMDALHFRLFRWLEREVSRQSGWQHLESGRVAIATDVGSERDENQDRVVVLRSNDPDGPDHLLAIVCDGMGGMRDGRLCASIAASGFIVAFLRPQIGSLKERLIHAAEGANLAIHRRYGGKGGATLSALCISSSGEACGVNVGDSRIYGSISGRIRALSVDDTIAGQIGRDSGGTEANSLLQFIGIGPDIEPHVVAIPTDLQWIFITTDGAHCIPADALQLLVTRARTATELSRRVVQAAQWMGSRDNGTVACVEMPLVLSPPVERSVSLVDPWGEMHLLNQTDNRQAPRSDVASPSSANQASAPRSKRVSSEKTRPDRSGKTRGDKSKGAEQGPDDRGDKAAQTIEITEIPEAPVEGDR
jgi:serine/threonine protein phosphatase PrpC